MHTTQLYCKRYFHVDQTFACYLEKANRNSYAIYQNSANSNDLERILTLFSNTKYLTNGYRYGHSYYKRRIGNRTQAFEWHEFQ